MMVTCKKWHVAKRLVERVRKVTNLPAMDYLFNEAATAAARPGRHPVHLEKRTRHRRALVRMLFDYWQTDRLVFCIDPASVDLMQDFYNDKAKVRLLGDRVRLHRRLSDRPCHAGGPGRRTHAARDAGPAAADHPLRRAL